MDLPDADTPATAITSGACARQRSRAASARSRCACARSGSAACRPALLGAQQRHLGAHLRAVGGEEGEQRVAAGVAARGAVRPHQRLGEVGPARLVELHERERQVGRDVDPAQRRIELDAVDDVDPLAEQDVLEPQVAVAVAHESRGGARVELVPERSQLCAGGPLEPRDRRALGRRARAAWRSRRRARA